MLVSGRAFTDSHQLVGPLLGLRSVASAPPSPTAPRAPEPEAERRPGRLRSANARAARVRAHPGRHRPRDQRPQRSADRARPDQQPDHHGAALRLLHHAAHRSASAPGSGHGQQRVRARHPGADPGHPGTARHAADARGAGRPFGADQRCHRATVAAARRSRPRSRPSHGADADHRQGHRRRSVGGHPQRSRLAALRRPPARPAEGHSPRRPRSRSTTRACSTGWRRPPAPGQPPGRPSSSPTCRTSCGRR